MADVFRANFENHIIHIQQQPINGNGYHVWVKNAFNGQQQIGATAIHSVARLKAGTEYNISPFHIQKLE
jgi:hypothetical protein